MKKIILVDSILYAVSIWLLVAAWNAPKNEAHTLLSIVLGIILTALSSPVMVKAFLFLILAPWHEIVVAKRKRTAAHMLQYTPFVSVIIPAWNEEVGIVATLKTLLASSYRKMEIIVVNDGSTDNSDQVIRTFLAKYAQATLGASDVISIAYLYKQNAGKAAALNTGIGASHGEVIVCIDADCLLTKDTILHFVLAMQDESIAAVCGNIKVGNRTTLLAQIQMVEYALSFYSRQTDALLNTLYVVSGAGGAYRREIFDRVGFYNTNLRGGGEDVDLSIRIQQAGMRITFAPRAVVYTEVPETLRGLLKQRKRWTRSRFDTFRRYPHFLLSRRREHNKLLTCFVLPLIAFNDWFYLLKMVLKLMLYGYCLLIHQYELLAMPLLITMVMSGIPLLMNKEYRPYLFLAPIYWLLGFIPAFIEAYAIGAALWGILHRQEVQWQQWQRQGATRQVKRK
jgi:cellulose synthase/poly-beta-1,6-N-acetylglucosamine synthase-like glycosyltransferase